MSTALASNQGQSQHTFREKALKQDKQLHAKPSGSDVSKYFVPTLNNMGYMTKTLDPYSQEFVEYAGQMSGPVLEVGAAYGIASLAALAAGAKVYCNDLDPRHLEAVKQQAIERQLELSRLMIVPGQFPQEITFPANTLESVLICRVIHFFDGETIEVSLQRLYDWLKPGGKLFIVAETPYLKTLSDFVPEYEKRVQKGDKWPGLITNLHQYFSDQNNPKFIHCMDIPVLKRVLTAQGFVIEKIGYINRSDFPEDRRLDGRESVGVIAYKPKD
jgi:SAM-dependent methyltransferase